MYAAKGGLETRDYTVANRELIRAQKILNYLKTTLNHQYEIANNLEMLYNFFLQQIVQANVRKSSEHMDDVIEMVTQLRDAFVQADKNVRSQG